MNKRYARYAAAKIARLERQINERLHLLAGERQLDEALTEKLICDDTIAILLKDKQVTEIIDCLVANGELIAIQNPDYPSMWSIHEAGTTSPKGTTPPIASLLRHDLGSGRITLAQAVHQLQKAAKGASGPQLARWLKRPVAEILACPAFADRRWIRGGWVERSSASARASSSPQLETRNAGDAISLVYVRVLDPESNVTDLCWNGSRVGMFCSTELHKVGEWPSSTATQARLAGVPMQTHSQPA